jgi:hypothetical protein
VTRLLAALLAIAVALAAAPAPASAVWLLIYAKPRRTTIERPDKTAAEIAAGLADRGDPVALKEDGFTGWGTEELLPPKDGGKFVRVKIAGVSVAQAEKYLSRHEDVNGVVLTYRKWHVLVDSLPLEVRQQLNQTGEYQTTWSAVRNFIHDKVNNVTE